jgi:cerevisin
LSLKAPNVWINEHTIRIMHFLAFSSSIIVAYIASVFAAPATLHAIETFDGEKTGRYIVTLKTGVSRSSIPDLNNHQKVNITHEWDDVFTGFAGHLDDDTLNVLRTNPDVQSIAEDGLVYPLVTQ